MFTRITVDGSSGDAAEAAGVAPRGPSGLTPLALRMEAGGAALAAEASSRARVSSASAASARARSPVFSPTSSSWRRRSPLRSADSARTCWRSSDRSASS